MFSLAAQDSQIYASDIAGADSRNPIEVRALFREIGPPVAFLILPETSVAISVPLWPMAPGSTGLGC